jgi:hypothetical protein
MAVTLVPYLHAVAEATDPKAEIEKWVGDVSREVLLGDRVLVATYARPLKIGSIWTPPSEVTENRYQGVVGLLLATAPNAFKYDGQWNLLEREEGESEDAYNARRAACIPHVGDWVVYRPADGFEIAIRQASCRVFRSESIIAIASDPLIYY